MASLKRITHKSGRVVYRIVICLGYDPQGKKLTKTVTYHVNQSATPKQQEKDALKYAIEAEDKIKYGYDLTAEKMIFEELAYKWLESIKDSISYGTYEGYKHFLEKRILPYFRGAKVAHIRTQKIEDFLKTLAVDYSIGTIKGYINVLNGIFRTAKRWGIIDVNPCRDAQKPKGKQKRTNLKYFTPQQSLIFLKSLDIAYGNPSGKHCHMPMQYKVFYTLSLFCGLRKGEALALHWSDIDFDKKEISIVKSIGKTENGFDYKEPKTTSSIRKIPFPDTLTPLLKKYHAEYLELKLQRGASWKGDTRKNGNLFIRSDGSLMGYTTTYQHFTRHLRRYNQWIRLNPEARINEGLEELPVIPLHGLRHSCATLLNHLEVNMTDISRILGHSTCYTTMNIYTHSFEEQKRIASDKLDLFLQTNSQ